MLIALPGKAQIKIVNQGKPASRIIADTNNPVDKQAADLLQDFIHRISGIRIEITKDIPPRKGDIVIGQGDTNGLTEDGFRLQTNKGTLYISSGGDKGTIYGVVTLLEDYFGVSYYGANEYSLSQMNTLSIPEINRAENPAFRYRQSQSYALREDPVYKLWFRLEEPSEVFAGGLWVHTFDRILPSDEYGDAHPEYYSFIRGERRPGKASQWCLTNPEVLEIVSQKVDSIFRANPGKNMISISQNDGNHTNCSCPECKAIDDYEGGPSGSLVHFLNKLAQRFPDKEFSTLAYLYTMHPPKYVKPLPNVNIMLCSIDAKREVPLTDNASGQDFVKAMKGWSAITHNIFVWDYGINFDNYIAPFPNFPVLQKNIQLFKEHNATMHFSQIASSKGGDFAEMRTFMVSKLMWNPYLNTDSLMRSFMDGYYGEAAPYIYQYEKLLEGGLLASKVPLWIYDSPVTHKDGMLNAQCIKRYNELFNQAEAAVANDPTLLRRVRMTRLPLQYSELEIARAEGGHDLTMIQDKLSTFKQRTAEYGIPTLNERNNTPAQYCQLYVDRYLPGRVKNLALGAKVTWLQEPSKRYKALGETALTDELFGGTTFVESWVGWEGCDGSFILDMGEVKQFSSVESDFLHQLGAWILLPRKVTYSYSTDGQNFHLFGERIQEEDRSPEVKFVGYKCESSAPVNARYLKVEIEGIKTCPSWHYGVGYNAWFFLDEVTVL
ncbi:MAG: DUF4838 domain-containing protein [Bacteroides sp.]|nr:DUF4838 domain-containing protein [Bacteroides sp.]